ncbi:MAG: hypothetical protein EBX41_06950 [Chitinophagia bacterium]|nr:hypothetical protein [Chitinophagia bacterium]
MKNKIVVASALMVVLLGFFSCTKKDTSVISQFTGSWHNAIAGSSNCGADKDHVYTIKEGNNDYTVFISYRFGASDTCQRDVLLTGNVVSGQNADYISINAQTFVDKCGQTYTITGSCTFNKDTLYITTNAATLGGVSSCTFKAIH